MIAIYLALLVSPLVIACLLGTSRGAKRWIGEHFAACMVIGWSAVLLLIPAALVLHGGARIAALTVICPLMALSIWRRADDGGGGGGGNGGIDTDPPLPQPPSIDWERFMHELDEYASSRAR